MRLCIAAAAALSMAAGEGLAHPDGAPWGAADPSAAEPCASCHFDGEPGRQTGRAVVAGEIPKAYVAGMTYTFVVTVRAPKAAKIGFLLEARLRDGADGGGGFISYEEGIETKGAEIRSTTPRAAEANGFASWALRWMAPEDAAAPVEFFLAANVSNDDQSPFGDRIEYLTFAIAPR